MHPGKHHRGALGPFFSLVCPSKDISDRHKFADRGLSTNYFHGVLVWGRIKSRAHTRGCCRKLSSSETILNLKSKETNIGYDFNNRAIGVLNNHFCRPIHYGEGLFYDIGLQRHEHYGLFEVNGQIQCKSYTKVCFALHVHMK